MSIKSPVIITISVLLIVMTIPVDVYTQETQSDSVIVRTHSPKKATWLSLIPGAGQIYNKKYWKLPIVYAGFGVTGYFGFWNRNNYKTYNDAYVCLVNLGDECENELALKYDENQLKTLRDYYRRNMELSFILMGVWYIIQILDATVDAHLYYWEVDDNLRVKVEPMIQQPVPMVHPDIPMSSISHNGFKISVNF